MKTIIAGSRSITDYDALLRAIGQAGWKITEVLSGGTTGVDRMGERWAKENGVPVRMFPADWIKYGKSAGPIRNMQMAEQADALIVLWDGKSKGAKSMIRIAREVGLPILVAESDSFPWDKEARDFLCVAKREK